MRFESPLIPCTFLRRYQRFLVDVEVPGRDEPLTVHCANTGRMTRCQPVGGRAWIRDSANPARTYRHSLELVEVDGVCICVNTARANQVAGEALRGGRIPALSGFDALRPEPRFDGFRLDFELAFGARRCLVEVKSVTLGEGDGLGRFPDAVTVRGRAHLEHLAGLAAEGHRAVMLFLALRDDLRRIEPADDIDPAYGEALRRAAGAGVEMLAWRCRVDPQGIEVVERVPLLL